MIYLVAFLAVTGPVGGWLLYAALHDPGRNDFAGTPWIMPRRRPGPPVPKRPLLPPPPPPPECPVPSERQAWIESSMRWLVREFGLPAALREVALPTPDFFPVPFTGRKPEIRDLLTRVCAVMRADPLFIWMRLYAAPDSRNPAARTNGTDATAGSTAVGRCRRIGAFFVVSLDRSDAVAPVVLAATIAHEIGHVRLIGEEHLTPDREDHEPLTDLVTVYLGMGVFSADSVWVTHRRAGLRLHHGYLSEADYGYALACYARLRGETEPAWAARLNPVPRRVLAEGLAYLAHAATGKQFPTTGPQGPDGGRVHGLPL